MNGPMGPLAQQLMNRAPQAMPSPFGQPQQQQQPGPPAGGPPAGQGPQAPGMGPMGPPKPMTTPDMAIQQPNLMQTMLANHQMGMDQGYEKTMKVKDPFGASQEISMTPWQPQPMEQSEPNLPSTPVWIRSLLGQN